MDRRSWGYGGGDRGGGYRSEYSNNYRSDYNGFGGGYGGYNSYNNSYNSYNPSERYQGSGYGGSGYGGYGGHGSGSTRYYPPARMPVQQLPRLAPRGRADWKKRRRDYNSGSKDSKTAAFLERKKRTLYIRNCPDKPEEELKEELKKLFEDCGKVDQITFSKLELNSTTGTDKKTVCEARVVMSTEDESKKGLEKHGSIMEERHLIISRQETDFETWKTTVVCCLNISLDIDEEDLWNFFEGCGKIKNIKRANAVNGDGRLYGQIHFEAEEDAQKAIALDGKELKGQALKLRMWASIKDRPELGVVVFNLPFGITRKEALDFMEGCGDVFSLKIDSAETTNRRAIFVFWDQEGVEKALERDNQELNKQLVRVVRWDGQRLINPVFLADLPTGILEVDLWKVFQVCGLIEHVRKEPNKHPTYTGVKACIEFQEASSVPKAVALDGIKIKGTECKVMTDKDEWDNYPPAPETNQDTQNGQPENDSQNEASEEQQEQATDESQAKPESQDELSQDSVKEENEDDTSSQGKDEPESSEEQKEDTQTTPVKAEQPAVEEGRSTRKRRAATATQVKTPPKTRRGR